MGSGVSSREGIDQIYKGQDQKAARSRCVMLIVAALLALLNFGVPPISVDKSNGTVCTFEFIRTYPKNPDELQSFVFCPELRHKSLEYGQYASAFVPCQDKKQIFSPTTDIFGIASRTYPKNI